MDNIRIIFVLPDKYSNEQEASEIMIQAYETCKQNVKSDVTWIRESDFDSLTVNKTDFVIFEEFKGHVYENLKETKGVRILGPWALSICLMEGKPIPNFPWPIYNVAMYECIVTCSNLPRIKKIDIKEKVQVMGGCYIDALVEKITHLVTDNPKSEKYLAAAEKGVKIMCSSWIEAIWEASQSTNIHAEDKEFEEHKCLPFQSLNISCTGLSDAERKELQKIVVKNGGKYSPKLKLTEADILVCAGADILMSEKYKAARTRPNIKCVTVSWITDSIEKGYALPHHLYLVKKGAASTPTKNETSLNFSCLSTISNVNFCEKTSIETTMIKPSKDSPVNYATPNVRAGSSKRKGNLKEDYAKLVDSLDIKKAKKAGQYLDGCSVYVTGFNPEHTEKLYKILNFSGATRYDYFSDRATHVIVGDTKFHEVKVIKNKGYECALVSVQWLLDSLKNKRPVSEENYVLSISDLEKSDIGSPLSKKGLNLLRTNRTIIEEEVQPDEAINEEDNVEKDIIQQYLKPANTEEEDTLVNLLKNASNFPDFSREVGDPPKDMPEFKPSDTSTQQGSMSVTQDETTESRMEMFFEGQKFLVIGFEDNHYEYIKKLIEGYGGELVRKNYKGIPDFIVVPLFYKSKIRHTATEVVNELFINECAKEGGLLEEICYYHRPFEVPDSSPLEGCVITISGYSSYERSFLKTLIEALGGYHQEQFSRVTSEAKDVVASTHLISNKPSGKKYQAAKKWKLPAVNKDWLLESASTGKRVAEADFAVIDNEVFIENAHTPLVNKEPLSKTLSTARSKQLLPYEATPKMNNLKSDFFPPEGAFSPSVSSEQNQSMSSLSCLAKLNTPPCPSPASRPVTPDASAASSNIPDSSRRNSKVLTPVNQVFPKHLNFNDSSDKPFSQATPVNKILKQYRESNTDVTPSKESPERFLWMGIKTPDTPLGACMCENPSPQLRKECELWLRQFPDFEPPIQRRLSTPLSEIKRKLWDKILKRGEFSQDQGEPGVEVEQRKTDEKMDVEEPKELPTTEENTQNKLLNSRLQQLEEMLSASGNGSRRQSRNFQSTIPIPEGSKDYKDSQTCTVGWDFKDQEVPQKQIKIFILTGVGESERSYMTEQIESLQASVSDLSNYDPSGTHLLCPQPSRNEKTLSFMASGKWILHTSYLEKSVEAGHFLDEEEYEFGNPKSVGKFSVKLDRDTETRMKRMHWWRKEVARRGYGAFNDMRAIVVAQKREPIVRVIEAGGGIVIDIRPPFDDTVHATHCLLEQRSVTDYADYIPLAQQGVYLLNTVYINDYLHQPQQDVRECILPYFAKYYSKS